MLTTSLGGQPGEQTSMDPRLYPSGSQPFAAAQTATQASGANLVATFSGNAQTAVPISALRDKVQTLTASGAVDEDTTILILNSTTPLIAATIAAPAAGRELKIFQLDGGTAGHTVTLTAGTFNGSNTIATLNAAGEALHLVGVSATRFGVLVNTGTVGFTGS